MANKKIIRSAAVKQPDGTLADELPFGSTFADVIDAAGSRTGATGYSLAQFFDSYIGFVNNSPLTYVGATHPTNSHVKLWIDTSVTNQDGFAG